MNKVGASFENAMTGAFTWWGTKAALYPLPVIVLSIGFAAGLSSGNGTALPVLSKELTRGPRDLVQHFRLEGEFTSAQERCMSKIDIWFGYITRLSQWGGGG
jgi:hypothetical protein